MRGEFPRLHQLLNQATITALTIDDEPHDLHTWRTAAGGRLSWLCLPPSVERLGGVFAAHQRLLRAFGGVVERSTPEPATWFLNCADALTAREARHDASFLTDYAWIMAAYGGSWPIDPASYYSICREANGNTTLYNRDDGTVLLFAPDHAFDHIEPLDGCPPYSLYRIPAADDFKTWVEVVARQWLEAIA